MATVEQSRDRFIRLSYTDGGDVIVTPGDEDRFVLTAQNAVKACQDHHRMTEAIQNFKTQLISPLIAWCRRHADLIIACYIPAPAAYLQVFVAGKSARYDFLLGQELAALELQFFDASWRVNVLQIPNSDEEDLQTYFNAEGALQVYAQLAATPAKGST